MNNETKEEWERDMQELVMFEPVEKHVSDEDDWEDYMRRCFEEGLA